MGEILSGLIDIELQPQGGQTLTRQLYQQLRAAILKGSLPPGHRLPSSRDLARQLEVSRNTVSLVVDQLAMEGYLAIAQGKASNRRGGGHGRAGIRPRTIAPAARRLCAFRAGRSGCANPIGPSSMTANRGRFFPASPMRARFRTTSGRAVFDARPATSGLRILRP